MFSFGKTHCSPYVNIHHEAEPVLENLMGLVLDGCEGLLRESKGVVDESRLTHTLVSGDITAFCWKHLIRGR